MDDEVCVTMIVPDLSYPPPGWGANSWGQSNFQAHQSRGRGGAEGHPTRVIRRTDLRARGQPIRSQKPPRFINLQQKSPDVDDRRKSWGEEWKPDEDMVKVNQELMSRVNIKDAESDNSDDGEWKQVKGRRWSKAEDVKKSGYNKHSDIPVQKKPPGSVIPSSEKDSPDILNSVRKGPISTFTDKISSEKSSYSKTVNKSPKLQKSKKGPESKSVKELPVGLSKKKSPEHKSHSKSPDIVSSKSACSVKSSVGKRRGSDSSIEEKKSDRNIRRSPVTRQSNARSSPPTELIVDEKDSIVPKGPILDSMLPPKMLLLSDLPDEQMVQARFVSSKLTEFEIQVKQEESQLAVQKDILDFLRKNWHEVSNELKESEHEWPPRVSYFSMR